MKVQKTLPLKQVLVLADHRESGSNVFRHLQEFECVVKVSQLKVGDYICSERVGVERKTVPDFLGSVFNQRLFDQLERLKESYQRPVLLIEGNPELLFTERQVNPNAVRGALGAIAVDFQIPLIWTLNTRETASQIYRIAYREQVLEKRGVQIRAKPRASSLGRQQEYLIAGLPSVSNVLSRRLLERFKTPKRVFSAKESQLLKVPKIGEEKAKKIRKLLDTPYKK